MDAAFIELPAFERHCQTYLDDVAFHELQLMLLRNPHAGDVIPGLLGLRKVRFADRRRHKAKRGGIRVIYYWWAGGSQFWLFTLYGKDVHDDLDEAQKQILRSLMRKLLQEQGK